MKSRIAMTLAALGVGMGLAHSQTVIINPEQETVIREYVTTQPVQPVDPMIDFDITVGSVVPDTVEVYGLEAPQLGAQYDYVVVDERTVVVEPETRRIIHIVE